MTSDHDTPGRSRLRWLVGTAGLLLIPLVIIWWPGCREYPAVTSREALYHMKLLYTACNTRDEKRLAEVEKGVEKLTREGKLSPEERAGFDKIIGLAKAGQWEDAEKAAFKFAQDQVGQGHPTPDEHHHHDHDHDKKAKSSKSKGK